MQTNPPKHVRAGASLETQPHGATGLGRRNCGSHGNLVVGAAAENHHHNARSQRDGTHRKAGIGGTSSATQGRKVVFAASASTVWRLTPRLQVAVFRKRQPASKPKPRQSDAADDDHRKPTDEQPRPMLFAPRPSPLASETRAMARPPLRHETSSDLESSSGAIAMDAFFPGAEGWTSRA